MHELLAAAPVVRGAARARVQHPLLPLGRRRLARRRGARRVQPRRCASATTGRAQAGSRPRTSVGAACLRVTIMNPRTSEPDVAAIMAGLEARDAGDGVRCRYRGRHRLRWRRVGDGVATNQSTADDSPATGPGWTIEGTFPTPPTNRAVPRGRRASSLASASARQSTAPTITDFGKAMRVDNILETIGNTPHVRINRLYAESRRARRCGSSSSARTPAAASRTASASR